MHRVVVVLKQIYRNYVTFAAKRKNKTQVTCKILTPSALSKMILISIFIASNVFLTRSYRIDTKSSQRIFKVIPIHASYAPYHLRTCISHEEQ